MGSPKEKTTTTPPSKAVPSSSSSKATQEPTPPTPPATVPLPPEWSSSLQAFYGRGPAVMPQAFYSPAPVAGAQPIVWGAQQVMPPYGSPVAYPSFYPHGGFYAQPPMNVGMAYRTPETEGRPPETKDKRSAGKGTSKGGGGSPGKSGIGTKGNASQSDDSATEGSSDTKEDDDQLKGHSPTRKRTFGNISAAGEASHPFSGASAESSYSGRVRTAKKLPVSAPGRAALPSPQTNLNIGMDLWGSSHSGSEAAKDERELRRERRKQSNRESARRSRLRKQQECEELGRRVTDLNSENNALKAELESLKKLCGELEADNKSIMGELKQVYGPEFLPGPGVSNDPSEPQAAAASS